MSLAASGIRLVAALGVAAGLTMGVAVSQPAGGRDTVPTPQVLVEKMLDLANVTAGDTVVDLGSGDGRTVIAAVNRGAVARGIEYNPAMVELSRQNLAAAGMTGKARIDHADIFDSDFSSGDVITIFLLPDLYDRLRPILLAMKPGTRVVSNTFGMGGWQPDRTATVPEECDLFFCKALLWIVPAKVEGKWSLDAGELSGELAIEQKFQNFTGTLRNGATVAPIHGRLKGNEIVFTTGGVEYFGQVEGATIKGITKAGDQWSARRGG
ncbi:MAG: class I SAM-dependent methyltransferase [Pseudorhodoplanes sp.]